MKFSTPKNELHIALQKVSKAAPLRSTLPILSCVLFTANEKKTTLRATDLEITIEIEISVSLEETGSCAIPLKQILDITNELSDDRITIKSDHNNKVTLITKAGSYDLMGKPNEEYPEIPTIKPLNEISFSPLVLKEIINSTLFAVSKDDLKPALTGVLFRFSNDEFISVATDGHRLAKHVRKDILNTNFSGDIIAPRKFLSYLSTQIKNKNIILKISEDYLSANIDNDILITRTIKERFPDYNSVIPIDNNKKLTTDKNLLKGVIKRVSIFSNKSTHQIVFNLSTDNKLITTEDPETSSKAQEFFDGDYLGDELKIGYNGEYLKDVVNHISTDQIEILFNTPISATIFNIENSDNDLVKDLILLMPIRLND